MTEFRPFPRPIAEIIADYCAELKLLDWIQPGPVLRSVGLYANPLAYKAGLLNLSHLDPNHEQFGKKEFCMKSQYSYHPCYCVDVAEKNIALDSFIKENHSGVPKTYYYMIERAKYVWSVKHLGIPKIDEPYEYKIYAEEFGASDHIDTEFLSENPFHADHIRSRLGLINKRTICANPAVIDVIKTLKRIDYEYLSSNPRMWALEQLRDHWDEIDIELFAGNPGIFHYATSKLIKLLSR